MRSHGWTRASAGLLNNSRTNVESAGKPRLIVLEDDVISALNLQQDLQDLGYDVPLVTGLNDQCPGLVQRWQPDLLVVGLRQGRHVEAARLAGDLATRFGPGLVFVQQGRDVAVELPAALLQLAATVRRPCEPARLQDVIELSLARHRLGQRLGALGAWFFSGIDESGDGILATDTALRITLANPAACELLGVRDTDIAGLAVDEVFQLEGGRSGPHPCLRAIESNKLVRLPPGTSLLHRPSRKEFDAVAAAPVRDSDGRPVGAILLFRAAGTRSLNPEDDGTQTASNLQTIATLVGDLSRDYNNLLAVIAATPELMRMCPRAPADFFAPLEKIQTSIRQAYLLAGEVLLRSGGDPADFHEVDLRKTANALLQFFHSEAGVELDVDIPAGLWKVKGDEAQLIQVLHNLLLHARRAIVSTGSIRLAFSNLPPGSFELPEGLRRNQAQAYVRTTVSDTGPGLSETEVERLFVSGDPGRSELALGLSTCAAVVRHHSGEILAGSDPGKGTTIQVFLPALQGRMATPERFERFAPTPPMRPPPVRAPAPRPPPGSAPPAPAAGKSRRSALVVDDEDLVRTSVAGMLKVLGFSVDTAWDGAEGAQKLLAARDSGRPHDVVILDLVIPLGISGEEAIREFQKHDPNVRAVLTSGYVDHPVVANYRNYGFAGFLKKPFGIKEIKAVLQQIGVMANT